MKRPGYHGVLELGYKAIHSEVDLWALARCVGGNHLTPFNTYALAHEFKDIIQSGGVRASVLNHVAFADWLRGECHPRRAYRDRNRKQLQYAAKAWDVVVPCALVVEALAVSASASKVHLTTVARAWLQTCTVEERAALVTVWRMGGVALVMDYLGDSLGALRRKAARLEQTGTPRSGKREAPP